MGLRPQAPTPGLCLVLLQVVVCVRLALGISGALVLCLSYAYLIRSSKRSSPGDPLSGDALSGDPLPGDPLPGGPLPEILVLWRVGGGAVGAAGLPARHAVRYAARGPWLAALPGTRSRPTRCNRMLHSVCAPSFLNYCSVASDFLFLGF